MRLGLFLTTLIGLAGASHISSAADATWIAVSTLENLACATQFGGPPGPTDWQVDIKGDTLTFYEANDDEEFIHRRFEGVVA
jgi:hypothetical protein